MHLESINPKNNHIINSWDIPNDDQVSLRLEKANNAYLDWKNTQLSFRISCLEDISKLLKERSKEYLIKEKENIDKKLKDLGVNEDLISHKGLTPGMLLTLGEKSIKNLKDFAELSVDELVGGYDEKKGVRFKIDGYLEEFALTNNEAEDLIINARNIVFK